MSTSEASILRNHFLKLTHKYFKDKNSKTKYKENERHAALLGLTAFITAYPYDIPDWMPEVLTAMVPAASDRPPIKNTATKTLSEFRRTHESENHKDIRSAFNEEQWEMIQGVGSQASYFT